MGRFLRIAVVRNHQLLEERLVPMGVDVTIGKAPGNTFVLPQADLPKTATIFKAKAERHAAVFTAPNGRVDFAEGEPATLSELIKNGLAQKKDGAWVLPLTGKARGKFDVGDCTVLFHYVERDLAIAHREMNLQRGPRPLVLEMVLSWEGTVLDTKKFTPLRPVTLGPGPDCDFQVPGRVLESRAYTVLAGNDDRFWIDYRNPNISVDTLESAVKSEDGTRSMAATEPPPERFPIKGPFRMTLALREGFTLDIRYAPAIARAVSSPFDISDPQPILCLAGSALFHAAIMLIAFAVGQSLLAPGEAKAEKVERRRELQAMLQEQKVEQKAEEEKKEAEKKEEKKEDDTAKKEEAKKPEPQREAKREPAKKIEAVPAGGGTPEMRRTKMKEDVRAKTFLNTLGGVGGEDGALPVGQEAKYADAFNDVNTGYAVNGEATDGAMAPPGPKTGGPEGQQYKTLSKEERGGDNIETTTAKTEDKGAGQETKVKVSVSTGKLGGEGGLGKIDNGAVAGVFARRIGAIKSCYEKELWRNPNLKGRITLRFTIGPSGRITAISAAQNTTGDDAIASCIIGKVENWKFDPPEGGAVTFTYPFILEAR